eukprot:gene17549-23873_t
MDIVLGTGNSGKSTIVHTLSKDPSEGVAPTVGFNIEKFKWRKMKVTGIIFVVDSSDRSCLPEASAVLNGALSQPECKLLNNYHVITM